MIESRVMREAIALEMGVVLFREYSEADVANFLDMHPRTLADLRRKGEIHCVRKSARNISYLGLHVVDFVIRSITGWDGIANEITSSEITGSAADQTQSRGVEPGTASKPGKPGAHRLAQQILRPPKKR